MAADVEPTTYQVGDATADIDSLVEAGFPPPSLLLTPFHYAAQKTRYRAAGGYSPAWASARALAERLEPRLSAAGCVGPVLVRCSNVGEISRVLEMAESYGFDRVIVLGAHISASHACKSQRELTDDVLRRQESMAVTYTPSLWSSDAMAELVANKALGVIHDPPVTGVALVVHGQPGDYAYTNADFDADENSFTNRVRTLLLEAGLTASRVRVCPMEWGRPDLTETVRHLGALGARHIAVVPACYPFANLQTLLDIPVAIREARLAEDVRVVQVPPWGDDPVFAEVLEASVRSAMANWGTTV
jgi:protoheme ferro-lyase